VKRVRGKIIKIATFALLVSILASVFAGPAFAQDTTVAVPTIVDPTLTIGSSFTINVTVHDVFGMLGYAFRLSYDPGILQATGYESNEPFTEAWPSTIGFGYVDVAYSWKIPEYFGQDVPPSDPPYTMASITFNVVGPGTSPLTLSQAVITDVFGGWTYPTVTNGAAEIAAIPPVADAYVGLTGTFIGSRHLITPDVIQTVTAQIENMGTASIYARANFVVVDALGGVVAVRIIGVYIMPGQVLRISADLDTTLWDKPASYTVQFTVEYWGTEWMLGRHGDAGAAKTTMIKTFSAE